MRDSVIFYISHYEVVKQLENEQLGKLYRALFETAMGNDTKIDDDIKIPFGFINNQMVLDVQKYNDKCLKNKENGKLGGRPKKDATLEAEKPNKANGFFENPNENENKNDNENENKNDNENDELELYDFLSSNFGYTISPIQAEKLREWLNVFNSNSEIIKFAIVKCCNNNARTFSYLEGILQAWKSKGFKTLDECKNEKKKTNNQPEWMDKEIKKEICEKSQIEMNELLKDFK